MVFRARPNGSPLTPGPVSLGRGSNQACSGDDPRLTDARESIYVDGVLVGKRRNVNFVAGTNVTLAGTDVSDTDTVDVTINSTGGGGGGAPSDAEYLLSVADIDLPNGRVLTNTATIEWDSGTPSQAKASIPTGAVTTTQLGGDVTAAGKTLLTGADSAAQRISLGLGTSATLDVGIGPGKVAAGDDSRLSDPRTADAILTGGTPYPIGSISSGEYLRLSGGLIVGGTPTGGSGSDTVFADAPGTDVPMTTTYADLFAKTMAIAVGDTIDFELRGTILNNSGVARTYSWRMTVGGMTLALVDGASVTFSATNRAMFVLHAQCAVTSTTQTTQHMDLWRTGPVATATSSSSATASLRQVWSYGTTNLTGASVNVKIEALTNGVGGTSQQMRVHAYKIIKTPQRI